MQRVQGDLAAAPEPEWELRHADLFDKGPDDLESSEEGPAPPPPSCSEAEQRKYMLEAFGFEHRIEEPEPAPPVHLAFGETPLDVVARIFRLPDAKPAAKPTGVPAPAKRAKPPPAAAAAAASAKQGEGFNPFVPKDTVLTKRKDTERNTDPEVLANPRAPGPALEPPQTPLRGRVLLRPKEEEDHCQLLRLPVFFMPSGSIELCAQRVHRLCAATDAWLAKNAIWTRILANSVERKFPAGTPCAGLEDASVVSNKRLAELSATNYIEQLESRFSAVFDTLPSAGSVLPANESDAVIKPFSGPLLLPTLSPDNLIQTLFDHPGHYRAHTTLQLPDSLAQKDPLNMVGILSSMVPGGDRAGKHFVHGSLEDMTEAARATEMLRWLADPLEGPRCAAKHKWLVGWDLFARSIFVSTGAYAIEATPTRKSWRTGSQRWAPHVAAILVRLSSLPLPSLLDMPAEISKEWLGEARGRDCASQSTLLAVASFAIGTRVLAKTLSGLRIAQRNNVDGSRDLIPAIIRLIDDWVTWRYVRLPRFEELYAGWLEHTFSEKQKRTYYEPLDLTFKAVPPECFRGISEQEYLAERVPTFKCARKSLKVRAAVEHIAQQKVLRMIPAELRQIIDASRAAATEEQHLSEEEEDSDCAHPSKKKKVRAHKECGFKATHMRLLRPSVWPYGAVAPEHSSSALSAHAILTVTVMRGYFAHRLKSNRMHEPVVPITAFPEMVIAPTFRWSAADKQRDCYAPPPVWFRPCLYHYLRNIITPLKSDGATAAQKAKRPDKIAPWQFYSEWRRDTILGEIASARASAAAQQQGAPATGTKERAAIGARETKLMWTTQAPSDTSESVAVREAIKRTLDWCAKESLISTTSGEVLRDAVSLTSFGSRKARLYMTNLGRQRLAGDS